MSLLRIVNLPARGIGRTTVDQLEKLAAERNLCLWDALKAAAEEDLFGSRATAALRVFVKLIEELREIAGMRPLDQTLDSILQKSGYRKMLSDDTAPDSESKLGNLDELLTAATEAAERGETITEFLDHAALVSDADQNDESAQISLLTIHNAKGLEFPTVFLAGIEEGLFPHSRSLNSEEQMEEERRLCYVGMTRAEQRLYLSHARYRRRYGGGQPEPAYLPDFCGKCPVILLRR